MQRQFDQAYRRRRIFGGNGRRCAVADGLGHALVKVLVAAGLHLEVFTMAVRLRAQVQRAAHGVHAPAGLARPAARLQGVFLRIEAKLHETALVAMHGEARRWRFYQAAGLQHHAQPVVVQNDVHIVDGLRAIALQGDIGVQFFRLAEQLRGLVQHVRTQVVQQAATGCAGLAPALADFGAETVEMRFDAGDAPQRTLCQQRFQGQEVAIPAPVVIHAEHQLALLRQGDQGLCFNAGNGEGLVDHHVLARLQGRLRQAEMRLVGRGDDHQFDGGVGKQLRRIRIHGRVWPVLVHELGLARGDGSQLQGLDGGQHGSVEGGAGKAVADQAGFDLVHGGFTGAWNNP